MEDKIAPLTGAWQIDKPVVFVASVFLACFAVRMLLAFMKTLESCGSMSALGSEFRKCLRGRGSKDPQNDDYWHPFILGLFELSAFPVLMVTEHWTFIGAWLAFKTLSQWKTWEDKRKAFNRFLIGNALVLFLSLLWLSRYVIYVQPK